MKNNETPVKTKLTKTEITKNVLSILFIILVVLQIGIVTGWILRSNDNARVQSEASSMVQSLKVEAQK